MSDNKDKKDDPMPKLYTIEVGMTEKSHWPRFRFRSLYNSACGPWRLLDRREAVEDGESHQKIILSLFKNIGGTNENI